MGVLEVESSSGLARVHLRPVDSARGWLLLGHGAGGGVEAPDLVAASEAALAKRVSVGLVEQPYRVAGRRSPAPARQLDAAWEAVVERLRELSGLPLLVGGRSLGARVACRTATVTEAIAVLCLAFPLQPPRRSGAEPAPSRISELDAVSVPTLVVQGTRDRFGMPPAHGQRVVVEVPGDHSLKADLPAVSAAVQSWLSELLAGLR
jgi:predicted alpha/beta-hydrolase family hydrolase